MLVAPNTAVVPSGRVLAMEERIRRGRRRGAMAAAVLLGGAAAIAGCRGVPGGTTPAAAADTIDIVEGGPGVADRATSPSTAGGSRRIRIEVVQGPVRAILARRLVAGPVRDRVEVDERVLLARGAAVDVMDREGSRRRVPVGGRTPIVDLLVHEGAIHVALRDGSVLRAPGRDLAAAFEPVPEPDGEASGDGVPSTSDERIVPGDASPVVLASLDGVLYRLHDDRVTRWTGDAPSHVRLGQGGLRGTVVPGADGPIVTAGRRAFDARTGAFAGSASRLRAAPTGSPWPGRLLYARNPGSAGGMTEVGAMDGRLREIDRDRARLVMDAPVTDLAFDRGRAIVATAEAVSVLGVADGRLVVVGRTRLAPGERLWAGGPDRAAVLRPDGTLAALPGDPPGDLPGDAPGGWTEAAPSTEGGRSPMAGDSLPAPRRAAFDGRTLRVLGSAGVLDMDLSGRVRRAPGAVPVEGMPDSARITRELTTRRGRLAIDPDGTLRTGSGATVQEGGGAMRPVLGLAPVDGFAWAAAEGRVALVDPRDGAVLATLDLDGHPRWIAPVPGGRGSILLTDTGEAWRLDLERRRE